MKLFMSQEIQKIFAVYFRVFYIPLLHQ